MNRIVAALIPCLAGMGLAGEPSTVPDFEQDILPIFSRRCHECHGPANAESGLRLDKRYAILLGGESGSPGIVPSQPDAGTILERVQSTDASLQMPPKGDRLTEGEIQALRHWVEAGAPGPDDAPMKVDRSQHWAFIKPSRPALPSLEDGGWPRDPVDAFVYEKMTAQRLRPAAEIDRGKWLRRVWLDLVGLMPSVEELSLFLSDERPDAHERQVDRLLSSPHFGERWARPWLDAARYADSNGYEKDRRRNAWIYRDWVVNATNADMPYDQFIIEQIAGDLLPQATQDQIVATGFLRNSMVNEEGAIDPEQFRMEAMFDRMDAIGKSILGLTIQCTQCHNHKFDPMSQEEYYRLFAFVNNAHEARPATYRPDGLRQIDSIRASIASIEESLRQQKPDWPNEVAGWASATLSSQPDWQIVPADDCLDPGGGVKYERLEDESWLAGGYAPANVQTRWVGTTTLSKVTGLRLEVLTHAQLPAHGPGRSDDGTWALSEVLLTAEPLDGSSPAVGVKFSKGAADAEMPDRPHGPEQKLRSGPVAFAIDGKNETAWVASNGPGRQHVDRTAVLEFEKPIEYASGVKLTITLIQAHGRLDPETDNNSEMGRFRLAVTSVDRPASAPVVPRAILQLLRQPAESRSPGDLQTLFGYWRRTVPAWDEPNQQIERLLDGWPTPTPTLALLERTVPRVTTVLKRGDWLKPTKPVAPGTPAFLHPLKETDRADRLSLARWLADRESPTTARVIVNRVWQSYFGLGLVASPEDLGTQSEPPTHPELLDWLACELMDGDWQLKGIHRAIATSSLYRQVSHRDSSSAEQDPLNRWLARGPRQRVEAELVRDLVLSASGLLQSEIGGPGVFPPAPAFLFVPPASYESFTWKEETGANRYRRSIYTFRRRSTPYPMLSAFDAPTGEASCVRRQRSNTPVQALVTLNEPVFFEAAQELAMGVVRSTTEPGAARVEKMFRQVTGRPPTPNETETLLRLFDQQKERFAQGWIDPKQVAYTDPAKPPTLPQGVTPTEMGAWTIVARVVLNLDETITKE